MLIGPRTTSVFIHHPDDLEELALRQQAVDLAEKRLLMAATIGRASGAAARAGDDEPDVPSEVAQRKAELQDATDAYDAAVDAAADRAVEFRLRSIGRRRWAELIAAHPARRVASDEDPSIIVTHPDDVEHAVNTATFGLALLAYQDEDDTAVRTIEEPALDTAQVRSLVDDELTEGDFERLWTAAYWLNRAQGVDGLGKYSTTTPSSSATETPPPSSA